MVSIVQSMRTVVEIETQLHGYTPLQFSERTGIHIEQLDNPRSVTVDTLDKISSLLGRPRGWLYEVYLRECFTSDILTSSEQFALAESLFEQGKKKEAIPLYRQVVDNRDGYDPQYIMSQFRLFQSLIGIGVEENREAVFRFETHYKQLPKDVRLDALLQMANVYYTFEGWKKVERYADEMRDLASKIYEEQLTNGKPYNYLRMERHLVVYLGQGYLLKGVALAKQEQYEEAKEYVLKYSDLGWFHFLDETGQKEVEKFQAWGKGNMYALELNTGNETVITEYLTFIEKHPNEYISGAMHIAKAACKFNFSVDGILEKLAIKLPSIGSNITHIQGTQLFYFWFEKSKISFKRNRRKDGIDELLYALQFARNIKYYSGFEKSVSLFWKHIDHATDQQKMDFHNIFEGEIEL
ncbi:DNA-binding protein [Paenibacillus sp. MZ04-78.2]|uniref:DNA-binding protein n=1 Tax=Paenibacillus sp. MZ04-78.2 TaxID=2962034 RepID=UPI0020B83387|nr:DNA-binding protein [Paenibacillus sp. MZ04-78.2]MCP3776395.1 DNA-binding protein [Paenibacillus sp. MZ04-78.2]